MKTKTLNKKSKCLKYLTTLMLILCIAPIAKSQIKIHNDGHISLMSSTKSKGVQIKPNGYTYLDTYLDKNGIGLHWLIQITILPNVG